MKNLAIVIFVTVFSFFGAKAQDLKSSPYVDVSDMDLFPPKFDSNDAGSISETTPGPVKNFSHINGKDDTTRLNKEIDGLSKGGTINVVAGTYIFESVNITSNIRLNFAPGVVVKIPAGKDGFYIGKEPNQARVENVKFIGTGTLSTRPKFILERDGKKVTRLMQIGYAYNVLIQNFTIEDNQTKGAAIAFNPVQIGKTTTAYRPEKVTLNNIGQTGGSVGYGLAQLNVGQNITMRNLSCEGGVTCRIESHNGRKYDLGTADLRMLNVSNKFGFATVLLQPHSVENGTITVDGATSYGSAFTAFIVEGFVAQESKRKQVGTFAANSSFKNISMVATDDTATLPFKNVKYLNPELNTLYSKPNFKIDNTDVNVEFDAQGLPTSNAPLLGPSVAAIYTSAVCYQPQLPALKHISITGKTDFREKILRKPKDK
ncbi:hypothetical protein [Flavobacterium fluviatile]|uniref:hypothetical protein n=1 Tax=Flavobacterium fluviatile TaxID=1862387 RepID=UPI0013D0FEA2|nr:hypothetical protein [Flavobacterium fluviatile]